MFLDLECVSEQRFITIKALGVNERVTFLESLSHFVSCLGCQNFVIFGDFNVVLGSKERWGVNGFNLTSVEFIDWVGSLAM